LTTGCSCSSLRISRNAASRAALIAAMPARLSPAATSASDSALITGASPPKCSISAFATGFTSPRAGGEQDDLEQFVIGQVLRPGGEQPLAQALAMTKIMGCGGGVGEFVPAVLRRVGERRGPICAVRTVNLLAQPPDTDLIARVEHPDTTRGIPLAASPGPRH
jgi:hypothetical protein